VSQPQTAEDRQRLMFAQTVKQFLNPILPLLEDGTVSEIMINGPFHVYIERSGKVKLTDFKFRDEGQLKAAITNIAQFVGRQLNDENPRMDARLPDGSRVHAIIPPICKQGVSVAIRKFSEEKLTPQKLMDFGAMTPHMADFLKVIVGVERNLLVSGGTGSGKTSLLNVLTGMIHQGERVVVIEDSTELQPQQAHVLQLESRPPDKYGRGEVKIRDLLHSSLRLRPDRVVIGEIRGGEALDLLQAMNTGHGGSMGTVHSTTPAQCLQRMETLCMFAGVELPLYAIRAQVAGALEMIVQTSRMRDGSRKITHITEVLPLDDAGRYRTSDIFLFEAEGLHPESGKVLGRHKPTGNIPTYLKFARANGYELTEEYFHPNFQWTPDKAVAREETH
jgi:pilus assembly protein CpaF